ncbi:MAG: hypothetical protein K0U86_01930 [Planctomycetes bacterium]|nr:hypothetical protein [Planctomycetota bacterium]MCH9723646.1 hypothetical protein [Planctomycetota bacterium]MCH9778464.1 hypothetical protein [Planctomycetota bacterium]MCH9791455.1 hypothetical protein [Planctomycetota bacterium]
MNTIPLTSQTAKQQIHWWRFFGAITLLSVVGLMGAVSQSEVKTEIPGWVVLQKSSNGDHTELIQKAIDSVARTGGTLFLPAGTYRHTGLIGRANVHLRGAHVSSVKLIYTGKSGDGITLEGHPDYFTISDLTLKSEQRSNGWAIRAEKGTHRSLRMEHLNIVGFENGILITDALNITIRDCRIGHTFPNHPKGIGIQIGNGRDRGGNGVTVADCYLNSLDKGIITYAQACLISRPIMELCHTGIETHGITSIVMPWYDSTTDVAHVSIQPNTVGGGESGTGVLLLGYGTSGSNIKYGSNTERSRTVMLPERLDFPPGDDAKNLRGIKLGNVVIDRDGVIYAREFKKLP